jgi:hypothetical protein
MDTTCNSLLHRTLTLKWIGCKLCMYTTCMSHVYHMYMHYMQCIPHVYHMYATCTTHVFHMYNTCIPHVQHMNNTCRYTIWISYVYHFECHWNKTDPSFSNDFANRFNVVIHFVWLILSSLIGDEMVARTFDDEFWKRHQRFSALEISRTFFYKRTFQFTSTTPGVYVCM